MNVPLTQGKVGIIDEIDSDLLEVKWCAVCRKSKSEHQMWFYVAQSGNRPYDNGIRKSVYMHRIIMERILGRRLIKGELVDHKNNKPLDNRRSNLRLATGQQNCQHRKKTAISKSSSFKGVAWHIKDKKWQASIYMHGKSVYLGQFDSEEDAAKAYDEAAKLEFGEFAICNF